MLRQIGVEGIVTSLHHVPNGEVWSRRDITEVKHSIEACGMRWSVVESLPVSEAVKYGGPDRDMLIERYIQSLRHLGECDIHTVCYNFMPVIDWIRTDLHRRLPDGTSTLYFDHVRFAYFDLKILCRPNAEASYSEEVLQRVEDLEKEITEQERQELVDTIILKTQGFISGNFDEGERNPVEMFNRLLALYHGVTKDRLRQNLRYFLAALMPVCEEYDINMCVHPDDPPRPVLGLPRIVCDAEDIRWLLHAVDNPHNGLTFCAGSLSSGIQNDVVAMAREFVSRTHFVHLRCCRAFPDGDFMEAPHTDVNGHLPELVGIFEKSNRRLPMRVDHGKEMLGDEKVGYNPGYSFHGRMLALGQVEGMMAAARCAKDSVC